MLHLENRIYVVTGAARGIGLAIGRRLLEEGATVFLCDVDEIPPDVAYNDLHGSRVYIEKLDVSDRDAIGRLAERISKEFGRVDGLVNNAAILDASQTRTLNYERYLEVLRINLDGALLMSAAAIPLLDRSEAASIVNVASIMGQFGTRSSVPYSTAKAGLINMTRCLAVDLAPGITVNAVAPGFIATRMALLEDGSSEYATDEFQEVFVKHKRLPAQRTGTPEDIAGAVAFLVSKDARYITGQVLTVDGGVTATY